MVTVVLLTTLLTPLIMRGAFAIKCAQDEDDNQKPDGSSGFSPPLETRAEA